MQSQAQSDEHEALLSEISRKGPVPLPDPWKTCWEGPPPTWVTSDWGAAFGVATRDGCTWAGVAEEKAAPFGQDDVAEVYAWQEGENDGDSWMMLGKLSDGRLFFITAWCDYTGWG